MIDSENQALPFASIQFVGTTKGTITNEDGVFIIDPAKMGSDSILITYMGYQSRVLEINRNDTAFTVSLKKHLIDLDVVTVIGDGERYAVELIKKLIRKYRFDETTQQSKAFMSLYSRMDQPLEVFEAFYNAELNMATGVNNLVLKNGRAGLLKKDSLLFVSLSTSDILCDYAPFAKNSLQKLPLSPLNISLSGIKRNYHFSIENIIDNDSEKTAVISFEPRHNTGNMFSGKLYLDIDKIRLQKVSLNIENTSREFLESIQPQVSVDSMNISLDLTYMPDREQLQSVVYSYSFVLSSMPNERIYSKALLVFYDYGIPFELPVSPQLETEFDYQRIFSYPYNEAFWQENYLIPHSENKTNFTAFFKKFGHLINYDSVTKSSPYLESPYRIWSETSRLQSEDILNTKPQNYNPAMYRWDSDYKGNFHFEGHIYLDYRLKSRDCRVESGEYGVESGEYRLENREYRFESRTSFNRSTSYFLGNTRDKSAQVFLNIYFDLHEVYRLKLLEDLGNLEDVNRESIELVYGRNIELLEKELHTFLRDTQKGRNEKGLRKWNDYINKKLKIDNKQLSIVK